MSRWALVALSLAGVAFGVYGEWAFSQGDPPAGAMVRDVAVGWAFIAAGLVTWRRRPANRMGGLMVAEGFAWFLRHLHATGAPLLLVVSTWFGRLHQAILAHLILAFPTGRLTSRGQRLVIAAAYGLVGVAGFLRVISYDPSPGPMTNPLLLYPDEAFFEGARRVTDAGSSVIALVFLGMVIRRWKASTGPSRRALVPVWVATAVALVVSVENAALAFGSLQGAVDDLLTWASDIGQLAVPLAFLYGILRTKLARSGVSELVVELGQLPAPHKLQDALARTLRDPSLQLAFWLPGSKSYVDLKGQPLQLPNHDSRRAVTLVEQEGQPLAAMIHDPALGDEAELMEAVRAAARLDLENERLGAEVQAQLEEVRASRARIVEAADAERRRIERNLHDGAQQRLVALLLTLRLAQAHQAATDPTLQAILTEASEELRLALSELRELARGIHPALLTHRGIGAALESLAEQAPVPVEVIAPPGRYPPLVEATTYFFVCEALANVGRYARASAVKVHIEHVDSRLIIEVADDGVGGADPTRGSGLSGLADRVAALQGQFRVESPPGRGTRLRAELPCG